MPPGQEEAASRLRGISSLKGSEGSHRFARWSDLGLSGPSTCPPSTLWGKQNDKKFAETLDATLLDIAKLNADIFSVKTNDGQKIVLFDAVTQYVHSQRDAFAKAIINKLIPFSFERIFAEKFDFYATLFEYLIKDYNKDGGGKYAEYYTPHAVAKIMAACLVPKEVKNVTCYDPAAGRA